MEALQDETRSFPLAVGPYSKAQMLLNYDKTDDCPGFAQQESDAEHQSEDEYTKPTTNVSVTDQSNIEQNNPRHIEPRKGGYDSRIEQILYENPDLEIQIISAGKSVEGGGYIVYTIRTGVSHCSHGILEFC